MMNDEHGKFVQGVLDSPDNEPAHYICPINSFVLGGEDPCSCAKLGAIFKIQLSKGVAMRKHVPRPKTPVSSRVLIKSGAQASVSWAVYTFS